MPFVVPTRIFQCAALIVACAVSGAGHAEERTRGSSFYGGPLFVTDASGIGLMIASSAKSDVALGFGSWVGYALSGPIVHWANGEVSGGFASLGLRAGLPIIGAMIGAYFPVRSTTDCAGCSHESLGLAPAVPGMLAGAAVGALFASAIDVGFLARRDDPPSLDPPGVAWLFGGTSVTMAARF